MKRFLPLLLLLLLALPATSTGRTPAVDIPIPSWHPVYGAPQSSQNTDDHRDAKSAAWVAPGLVQSQAATMATPTPAALVATTAEPTPPVKPDATMRGLASWYPTTRGWSSVPHVALPGARYVPFGQPVPWVTVTVILDGRVVSDRFPVVDWCGCPGGRIVDLSLGAVEALGLDPSRGLWPVILDGWVP